MQPMFDIVVPVHNSLHHVRSCLLSVRAFSTRPYHLHIVDDASQPHAAEALDELMRHDLSGSATLHRNAENEGYLRAVNRGAQAGSNPYIICLNSDTVVTPGHLERLEAAFASDPAIGVVNAVSNWANWTRICWDLPEGHNVMTLAAAVARLASDVPPDIYLASGFYFAIRRSLFEQLNGFDEVYGLGYYEESDFCMRAIEAGHRVVVDDGLYIYHHGWGSFGADGRNAAMEKNKQVFEERWGASAKEYESRWRAKNPIPYMDSRVFTKQINEPAALRPVTARAVADSHASRFPLSTADANLALNRLREPNARDLALPASSLDAPSPGMPPVVVYILPAVKLYGGIISVLQVVNQLILNGLNAQVVTCGEVDEEVYRLFPVFFRARQFTDAAGMLSDFPDADLVVATGWDTAYAARALQMSRPFIRTVYFVQDYEPDFYTGTHPDLEEQARRTYSLIPDQIVKTRWLARKLKRFGQRVHRIPLGLHLDYFHDAGVRREPAQVLALGRPSSVRRNWPMVCQVFALLHRARPDLRLAIYGEGYDADRLGFPVRDYGKLTRMEEVASALNDSTILLDCSTFQGFGRPGLEAMACGTAAVLTHEGGITQYAKHEYNCLLCDPQDAEHILETILRLIHDAGLRERLIAQGKRTAKEYAVDIEGRRTAALFRAILADAVPQQSEPGDWDTPR